MKPRARSGPGLLIHTAAGTGGLLVYDRTRGQLHWLNPVAAAVWHSCDGETVFEATPGAAVTLALRRLVRARLIESLELPPASSSSLWSVPIRQLSRTLRAQAGSAAEARIARVSLGCAVHAESAGPCRAAGEQCGPTRPPCCPGLDCGQTSPGIGICR